MTEPLLFFYPNQDELAKRISVQWRDHQAAYLLTYEIRYITKICNCEAQAKAKAKDRPGMVTKRSLKALRLKPLPRAYIKVGCHHHIAASSTKSLKIRLLNS